MHWCTEEYSSCLYYYYMEKKKDMGLDQTDIGSASALYHLRGDEIKSLLLYQNSFSKIQVSIQYFYTI